MKRISRIKYTTLRFGRNIASKKKPVAATVALTLVLATYHNCGSKSPIENSSSSAATKATSESVTVVNDGHYQNTMTADLSLYLDISNGGKNYTMTLKRDGKQYYMHEVGELAYSGGKVTFVPKSYYPAGCAHEGEFLSESDSFEFMGNSRLLAFKALDMESEGKTVGLLFSATPTSLANFLQNATPSCQVMSDLSEGDVEMGGVIPDEMIEEAQGASEVADFEPTPIGQTTGNTDTSSSVTFDPSVNLQNMDLPSLMESMAAKTDAVRPCAQGARLSPVYFKLQTYNQNTLVANQTAAIRPPTSIVNRYYIGLSNYGDAMVVSLHGEQYYLAYSFCPYSSSLKADRAIQSAHTPYGIVISPTEEMAGTIAAAKNTAIYLGATVSNAASWFGPTTFFPVTFPKPEVPAEPESDSSNQEVANN